MSPTLQKMKVLAVDDNRTNLHILQVFLKKLGHDVILAENGEEAVRRFNAERPDLVLLDIMMPIMDGFEAARRMKASNSDRWTPIIFLSALNRDENLVEGLDAGADDYLTKPINFVVLEAKLRSMQRSLRLQQQSFDALRRLQAISDNVLDALVTIDEEGKIISVNPATERMFRWAPGELPGRNVNVLVPEPDHSRHDAYLARYREERIGHVLGSEREVQAMRRDGSVFPATLAVSEVLLDNQRLFIGLIRDISERRAAELKLRENAEQLRTYYEQTQSEQQLAMRLMEKQLHRRGLTDSRLHYKVIPAESFSGDIVAAATSPNGRFFSLLADATGHGLSAAISVLPVLALFYRMAKRDRSVREMVQELNQQLKEAMPVGRFVGATLICLDDSTRTGEIWVGGTPDALLVDQAGRVVRTFPSENLPLGILDAAPFAAEPVAFSWAPDSQLVLFSDGLVEATDRGGRQFGSTGLTDAMNGTSPRDRFERIEGALSAHLAESVASDDISLMVIDCP
jgi:PAS domain S-box-containing protein